MSEAKSVYVVEAIPSHSPLCEWMLLGMLPSRKKAMKATEAAIGHRLHWEKRDGIDFWYAEGVPGFEVLSVSRRTTNWFNAPELKITMENALQADERQNAYESFISDVLTRPYYAAQDDDEEH